VQNVGINICTINIYIHNSTFLGAARSVIRLFSKHSPLCLLSLRQKFVHNTH